MENIRKTDMPDLGCPFAGASLKALAATSGRSLQLTAALRLENPELTLSELAEEFDPPVTKSCLNHRLRKITQLAKGI